MAEWKSKIGPNCVFMCVSVYWMNQLINDWALSILNWNLKWLHIWSTDDPWKCYCQQNTDTAERDEEPK